MSPIQGALAPHRGAAALPTHVHRGLLLVALVLTACGAIGPGGTEPQTFVPPPPLSLVAIVDPSANQIAGECQQLAEVVRAGATPSETLVLNPVSSAPLATYVVRKGDTLNSIARSQGLSLATLEAANPQLGPVAHRDWN